MFAHLTERARVCVCVCLCACAYWKRAWVFAGVRRASAGTLHDSRRVPAVCMHVRKDRFGEKKKKKIRNIPDLFVTSRQFLQ